MEQSILWTDDLVLVARTARVLGLKTLANQKVSAAGGQPAFKITAMLNARDASQSILSQLPIKMQLTFINARTALTAGK